MYVKAPPYELIEYDALPQYIKADFVEHITKDPDYYKQGKPCFFLQEDNTCRHYDNRPVACKEFLRGSDFCHQAIKKYYDITIDGT
jgi:Fe-S-cluster containining protein